MRLVIDSNIFVSSLDPKDVFHEECYPILEKMLSFDIEALCPSFVLVETICVLRRRTNSEQVALAIYQNLSQLPAITWLDMNLQTAERACMLGARTGLKGGDTVVLQVAEHYGIPLVTKDKEIKQKSLKHITVLEPREVL
jgi:predicted nucleic acid-binding protein